MDVRGCANFGTEGGKEMFEKYLLKRKTGIYVSCWLSFFHNKLIQKGENKRDRDIDAKSI